MCIDYQDLIQWTRPDKYRLLRIDDLLDRLPNEKYFLVALT